MIIGKFRKDDNGCFTGSIPFITSGSAAISIAPVVRPGTDYTVTFKYDEAIEIGQARFRKNNTGDKFLAVTLDTPHLRESITCKLVDQTASGGGYALVWERDPTSDHAQRVLAVHAQLKGTAHGDGIASLLHTLMHYCDAQGKSFQDQMTRARYLNSGANDEIEF